MAATLAIALLAPPAQAEPTFRMPDMGELQGVPVEPDKFVMGAVTVGCKAATYSWNAGRLRTLVLFPEYGGCTARALSGFPADFYQETCTYLLHDLEALGDGNRWQAAVAIQCTGDWTEMGWELFETEQKYAEVRNVCSMRIPEQAGRAELRNLPGNPDRIEIRWDFNPLEYFIISQNGIGSSLLCGSTLGQLRRDAYYEGAVVVTAKDAEGRTADIRVVD